MLSAPTNTGAPSCSDQHPGKAKPDGDKGLTCVMEPRYVMGDSGGGLDVGVPLVMLPPEAEPREAPAGHKHSELEAGFAVQHNVRGATSADG